MVVNVLVEISHKNIDKTFDYLVPKHLEEKVKIGKSNSSFWTSNSRRIHSRYK